MTERQYIVGRRADGDEKALEQFFARAENHDQIQIVSGKPGKILILKMTESTAEEMRKQFKKDLSIEEDAPLQY